MTTTNECNHGQLARSCELCEKDAEIAQYEKMVSSRDQILSLKDAEIAQRDGVIALNLKTYREAAESMRGEIATLKEALLAAELRVHTAWCSIRRNFKLCDCGY